MKPYIHARTSARKYGGEPAEYYDIHEFIDSSKAAVPDMRHRALLHNAFGCYIVQSVFGIVRTNSAGKEYSPRDVAEDHVIEDLGFLPTVEQYLRNMVLQPWMGAAKRMEHIRSGRERRGRIDPMEPALKAALQPHGLDELGHLHLPLDLPDGAAEQQRID